MNKTWLLPLTTIAALAVSPARADVIDAKFSGSVASQGGTSLTVNSPVSGEFVYNTTTSAFLSFTIGGVAVAPGYGSTALVSPDQYSAQYQAQLSPVTQGGTLNSTFNVDLEGLSKWPTLNAIALLTNASLLASNLDTINSPADFIPSTFGYVTGNANGTNIRQLSANLTSLQVSVPEPASLTLLAAGCIAMAFWRRGKTV